MIEIYDNGGTTFDRYTIIIDGDVYGMSENPQSPQGFNQYSGRLAELPMARSNGERITMESLPEAVQKAIEERAQPTIKEKSIKIPFSDSDLEDLMTGQTFDWVFISEDGHTVNVHLFKSEEEGD
jgi:hypothetical protein